LLPLTAGVQAIQDIVEDFVERDFALVASLSGTQIRSNILLKLFFGYTDGDSAHGSSPLVGFLNYDALSSLYPKV
jgi:hypothetical protein